MTQEEALNILKTGANVFLTGEPGSGKTHTINNYVDYLREHGIDPSITASTGIAATHIGGMTIHSWSGIGVKSRITEYDLETISEKERVVKRIVESKVLIIDEISMLSSETFDSVELVCRTLRRNDEVFGGLQVVLVGDFFQLPPIEKRETYEDSSLDFGTENSLPVSKFAFRSGAWAKLRPIVCYLSEQHRQEDMVFLKTLAGIRSGELSALERETLEARCFEEVEETGITKLFPHNADVDRINDIELGKIDGVSSVFVMNGKGSPHLIESLKKSCLSPATLSLKLGAKVMFTKNSFDRTYVNGTIGVVGGFSKNGYPIVETKQGKTYEAVPMEWSISDGQKILASVTQVPLRLAWAITVHKSQGMSLESAVIDLRNAFEYGQGYVALSRVRSFEGLHLLGFNERALEVHPEVLDQDNTLRDLAEEARTAFGLMKKDELSSLHINFIKASGGVPGGGQKVSKKIKERHQSNTYESTLSLILQKKNLKEISNLRGLSLGTVLSHLEKLREIKLLGLGDISYLKPKKTDFDRIKKAFLSSRKKTGDMKLSPVHEVLDGKYDFETLRLARLFII